ncbi:hypothetical protein LX36DRAFT_382054 [Colletotrichum falcatum]|nr:hypothetical protein LX36DRAFT_382054 [Colletotrichum falcatum]
MPSHFLRLPLSMSLACETKKRSASFFFLPPPSLLFFIQRRVKGLKRTPKLPVRPSRKAPGLLGLDPGQAAGAAEAAGRGAPGPRNEGRRRRSTLVSEAGGGGVRAGPGGPGELATRRMHIVSPLRGPTYPAAAAATAVVVEK